MNKKQRDELEESKWRAQFTKDGWNGTKAVDFFANQYERNSPEIYRGKPKDSHFNFLREVAKAESQVYHDIAHLAYEKEKIVTFLNNLNIENIWVPSEVDDVENFKKIYSNLCKEILEKINISGYDFQY